MSRDEKEILSRGLKFIPNPTKFNIEPIIKDVEDFSRKIKLQYFFRNQSRRSIYQKLPFTEKSKWVPPEKMIPEEIKNNLASLTDKIKNVPTLKNKFNLTRNQMGALRNFKNKTHLIIKKADKGSATVLMKRENYIREAERQLSDSKFYTKLNQPIYPQTSEKIMTILNDLKKSRLLTELQVDYLKPPSSPRPRQFYLLPKIHKDLDSWTIPNEMPPGRPIVSDCSSESYRVSEYIDSFLQPIATKHPSYIKDTWDFLEKLTGIVVPENALLVTLDVESLYTNIPINQGLNAVRNAFLKNSNSVTKQIQGILDLLELGLKNNDFQFNDQWYLQTSGTAMGKVFAPSYANIYMAQWEGEVLNKTSKKPLSYTRFLDDIFLIWPYSEEEFKDFFELMNNHSPSIKLKYTIHNSSIDFLDVTIFKGSRFKNEGILDTKVYFKPTDTHELLHKSSFHPKHTFKGVLKSQLIRFFKICNNFPDFEEACKTLFDTLKSKRNYSSRFLRAIKSSTLKKLQFVTGDEFPMGAAMKCNRKGCECCLWLKPNSYVTSSETPFEYPVIGKLTCESTNLIYLIECTKCNEFYVGETSTTLRQRLTSHLGDIRNEINSKPIPEHFNDFHHDINQDMVVYPIEQILEQGSKEKNKILRRKIEFKWMEALKTMYPNGMNIKIEPSKTIAFTIPYSATGVKISNMIRQFYNELQVKFPRHLRDELVIGYKRNKNLGNYLVSTKLKNTD